MTVSFDRFVVCGLFVMAILFDQHFGYIAGVRVTLLVNIMLALVLFVTAGVFRRLSPPDLTSKLGISGIAYCGFLVLSTTWSINPTETFFQSILFIYFTCVILSIRLYKNNDPGIELIIIKLIVGIAFAGWLLYFVMGDIALSPKEVAWRLRGILNHEQRQAIYMSFGLILLVARRLRGEHTKFFWLFFFILSATLFATFARAFTAFTILILATLLQKTSVKTRIFLIISYVIIGLGLAAAAQDIISFFSRGDADLTLTGRTSIWIYSWEKIKLAPIGGYGYASFQTMTLQYPPFADYSPPHAHNTTIHALVETGAVGLFLLYAWVFKMFRLKGGKQPASHRSLLIAGVLFGTTGIIFGEKMSGALVLMLLAYATSFEKERHHSSNRD